MVSIPGMVEKCISGFFLLILNPFGYKKDYIESKTFYEKRKGERFLEDRELIRRIQSGQKEYLNEIAEKYYDDIYYFCCYQTGSREDAYDLAQETFLRFIRYAEHYRYSNLKGYLLTIAMNLCRSYFHGTGRTRTVIGAGELIEANGAGQGGPAVREEAETGGRELDTTAQAIEVMEQSRLLTEALMKLPDMQREAVLLHHFYGYKNREIAHMTGASCATVKSRVNQGLGKLQQLLNREDFYE